MDSFLIIEGDVASRTRLAQYFRSIGCIVEEVPDHTSAVRKLERRVFDVVLAETGADGAPIDGFLTAAHDALVNAVIVAMCEPSRFDAAIHALQMGAIDIVQKPVNIEELTIKIAKGEELKRLAREGDALRGERNLIYRTKNFIGKSPAIREVLAIVDKVARTSSSVILLGETGTGKELIAGALHYSGPRAAQPFIRVNCATLPEALLESELFGHEKGAFTGAEKQRIGRFEQGNGGTIFLDEIADTSLGVQVKLLRVLQEQEFERLGSNRTIRVDVRVIAASNKDLASEIKEGRFRMDLYYRLNVVTIRIPPLRDREGDIELLSNFFLRKYARDLNRKVTRIDPSAMQLLLLHRWPGNIRELENTIERALIMAEGDTIQPENLALQLGLMTLQAPGQIRIPPEGIKWRELERDLLMQALDREGGDVAKAARLLGLTSRSLLAMMKRHGIEPATGR